MTARVLSASAALFAEIVERSSAAHLARSLDCDESAVRFWASGKRVPNAAMRHRLAAFDERLSPAGWVETAAPTKSPQEPTSRDRGPVPSPAPLRPAVPTLTALDGEGRLLEVIRQCDELLAEASDPKAHASIRDRTAILAAKSSAVVRLTRLRGEDAVTTRKILESTQWKTIWQVVLGVLEGSPDLLAKILERLEVEERRGGA